MFVAQKQEAAPGLSTAANTTTSKKSAILLPSVALMLALSCLFTPTTVQAGPAANTSVTDAVPVKPFGSSPSFSLPPLNWIRTHLGTKSPYPHESRPVGLLKDTPKGYELVQLHLVRIQTFFTHTPQACICLRRIPHSHLPFHPDYCE